MKFLKTTQGIGWMVLIILILFGLHWLNVYVGDKKPIFGFLNSQNNNTPA